MESIDSLIFRNRLVALNSASAPNGAESVPVTARSVLLGALVWMRNTRMAKSRPVGTPLSLGLDRTPLRAKIRRPCSRRLVLRTKTRAH
jgi:hypothetical protein